MPGSSERRGLRLHARVAPLKVAIHIIVVEHLFAAQVTREDGQLAQIICQLLPHGHSDLWGR